MAVILVILVGVWASSSGNGVGKPASGAGKQGNGEAGERVSHASGGDGSPGGGAEGTKPEASAVSPSAAATRFTPPPALAQEPQIRQVSASAPAVGLYEKLELTIALTAEYYNPYDPQELDLGARLTAPSGANWDINGFYDGAEWKLRFSPDEPGEWTYTLHVQDRNGRTEDSPRSFTATTSAHRGWIGVAADNPRFLAYRDGSPFYGIGVAYPWGITESGLDLIAANGGNLVTYWNGNYDNAGSGGGSEQLESVTSGLGRYDMRKAARIDELLEWFEARDMQMSFVIWPHDSLADKIDWPAQWSKNAYSTLGEAVDFYASEAMWKQQEKLYRYLIARYGHSRSLGIWDLICEVTGTDGYALGDKNQADAWLTRIHQYFKTNDPYNHLTMGSAAGNAEDYWEHAYQTLDLADRENYYSLHYRAYAEDIARRWTYGKPLVIGETGNVADADAYHNLLWVTLANGLASTPIWWDVTKVDEAMYDQMKIFAAFVADLDLAEPRTPVTLQTEAQDQRLPTEGWMMQGAGSSYGWMISGQGNLSGRTAKVPGWPADHPPVRVHWYDPWSGQQLAVSSPKLVGGNLLLTAPPTERLDLAFTLEP